MHDVKLRHMHFFKLYFSFGLGHLFFFFLINIAKTKTFFFLQINESGAAGCRVIKHVVLKSFQTYVYLLWACICLSCMLPHVSKQQPTHLFPVCTASATTHQIGSSCGFGTRTMTSSREWSSVWRGSRTTSWDRASLRSERSVERWTCGIPWVCSHSELRGLWE